MRDEMLFGEWRESDLRRWAANASRWLLAIATVAVLLGCALMATGCAGVTPPPIVKPTPPPVVIVHTPVCDPATGLVLGCWHQPPGQAWAFIPPAPPKPETACPKKLAPGAHVYVQAKYYGNGVDGSPRVVGDPEFCRLIHGVAVSDCHLEGWAQRAECEMELLGATIGKAQACPEWEFRENALSPWRLCKMTSGDSVTCDHHGNTAQRDDPQTPPFEGAPAVCGEQRDGLGNPKGGYFIIAHGVGDVRACTPDHNPLGCGDPKVVIDPSTR